MANTSDERSAEVELSKFGYGQEFKRTFHRFALFAIGFSFISITTGIFTTYGSVLSSSGPLGIWTWPIVVVGQLMVALVFGLLASRMPLAGYAYQWMSRLANPYIGWIIGWFVFAFLVVDVVAVDYSLAQTVLPALFSYTSTVANAGIAAGIIVAVQALTIMFSTVITQKVNNAAVATEIIGIGGLTLVLLIVGAARGMLHWGHVFSRAGVSAAGYFSLGTLTHDGPWLLAFLLGSFTIVGFEAAGNLAEETKNPDQVVPRAMWSSVLLSGVLGFVFLVVISAATSNFKTLETSSTPVATIVITVLGPVVGKIFLVLVLFSIFACGLVIFVTVSRVTWAMSRDQRFPGYKTLRGVNRKYDSPLPATIVVGLLIEVVLAAFALRTNALFDLFSAAALMPAIIYLVTVILYLIARRHLPPSRFHLGKFEIPVAILALVWLVFEMSIFRDSSFATPWEYAGVMVAIGLVYFIYLIASKRHLDMPGTEVIPLESPSPER